MARKHVIGPVDSIPTGGRSTVRIGHRQIVIFNVEDRFYALRDICPHQGACLSGGNLVGGALTSSAPGEYEFDASRPYVRCPWHGWEYELATGHSYFDPRGNRVKSYDVHVEPGGEIDPEGLDETARARGPHTAETFPISVENDYIVLEI